MKKILLAVLCAAMLLTMAACSSDDPAEGVNNGNPVSGTASADSETVLDHTHEEVTPHEYTTVDTPALKVNKVVNADEMAMYNAIFFNNDESYMDTEMTKTGIFTILYDAFHGTDRYYVWGYADDSAASGWQWEFTVTDPAALPKVGSEVTVTGKFVANDNALDKKWIENASVTVVSEYNNALCKYDLTTMSPILSARVQVPNIQSHLDQFNDKICLYAKVGANNILVSAYDDLGWTVHTVEGTTLPAEGTIVTVVGTFDDHGHFVTDTLNIEG